MTTNNVNDAIIAKFINKASNLSFIDIPNKIEKIKEGWSELYLFAHAFPGNMANLQANKEFEYKSGWAKDNAKNRIFNIINEKIIRVTGLNYLVYPICVIRVKYDGIADTKLHKNLPGHIVNDDPWGEAISIEGNEFYKTNLKTFINTVEKTFNEHEFIWIHDNLLNDIRKTEENPYTKAIKLTSQDTFSIIIDSYFSKFNKKSKDDKKFNILLSAILIFVLTEKEIGLTTVKTENIIGYDKHVKRLDEILKSLINDIKFKDDNEKNIYSVLKIKNIKDFNDCYYIIDSIIYEILNNSHNLSKYEILKCIFKNIKNDCKSTEMKSFLSDFFIYEHFMKYINNININKDTKIFLFRLSFEFIEKIFCIKKARAYGNPTNKDIFSTITIGCSSELFIDIISMFISEKYNIEIDDIIIKQIKSEKDINKMKFDVCLMNPPYAGNLHLKILEKAILISDNVISIQPIRWLQDPIALNNKNSDYYKYEKSISKYISDLTLISGEESKTLFNIIIDGLAIYECNINGGYNYKELSNNVIINQIVDYINNNLCVLDYDKNDGYRVRIPTIGCGKSVGSGRRPPLLMNLGLKRLVFKDGKYNNKYWHEYFRKNQYSKITDTISCSMKFDSEIEGYNFIDSFNTDFVRYVQDHIITDVHISNNKILWMGNAKHPRTGEYGYKSKWTSEDFYNFFNISIDNVKIIQDYIESYYDKLNRWNNEFNKNILVERE